MPELYPLEDDLSPSDYLTAAELRELEEQREWEDYLDSIPTAAERNSSLL
jgi:hypothetical protein